MTVCMYRDIHTLQPCNCFLLIINSLTLSPLPFTFHHLLPYKPFPQRHVPPPFPILHLTSFYLFLIELQVSVIILGGLQFLISCKVSDLSVCLDI